MILLASASEIARMHVSQSLRPRAKPDTARTPRHEGADAASALLLPSQQHGVIRRSRKEEIMPYLAQRSGSVRGRALPGCLLLACALTLGAAGARADEPTRLRVNAFPQAKTLPLHAGIAKGIFERRGFKIELQLTENSRSQRDGLAAGTSDVVHSAVDNALAMVEIGKHDVVIVTGGDSGMNEFFVQGEVKSFADMRGRTLVVDAPDTAYALQAKKILAQNGLKDGTDYTVKPVGAGVYRFKAMVESKDNAAAILNLPFTVQAEQLGMKSLGRTIDLLGPYQAGGVFVMRGWARDHAAVLERYIAAYVEALRWTRDPANRAENIALLMEKLKISSKEAERTYELLVDPAFGFTPDARFDLEGFNNALALRAEIEGGKPAAPERYIDLGYYERALPRVGR
jgi:ABC-type nitrate/sulfonate/bicarbonate transport system substrate-binding protein